MYLLTHYAASIRFLVDKPALCLRLPIFAVARNTLAVRLALPLVGRAEDFHLQERAHAGRTNEKSRHWRLFPHVRRVESIAVRTEA